jgi:radical SAM-linked protein
MKEQRFRIYFSKTEQMKYTSHLDLILTWERTFRRAKLPLAYSEGFSPRPVLNLAAPLPLGYTSIGEIGDFWMSEIVDQNHFSRALEGAVPPGIEINKILQIKDIHGPKLPSLVKTVSYKATFPGSKDQSTQEINRVNQSKNIIRSRKNKEYDLRPLIKSLELAGGSDLDLQLKMTLTSLPGATGRPDEVLDELGIQSTLAKICRTKIILKNQEGT